MRKPPIKVSSTARKGIALALMYGGIPERYIRRARGLDLREPLDAEALARMRAFFQNYNEDLEPQEGKPSTGYIVYCLWGGDAAKEWLAPKKRKRKKQAD